MIRSLAILSLLFSLTGAAKADEARNAAKVKDLFAAFNAQNVEAMVQMYAPEAQYISPDVPPGTKGQESIRKVYQGLFRAIPDVKDTVTRIVAQGDTVAVEFVARGTAPARGDKPARPFELPIASFLTFDARGYITRDASYHMQ